MDIKDNDARDPAAPRSRADEVPSRLLSETSPFFVDVTEKLIGQGFAILGLGPMPPAAPEPRGEPLDPVDAALQSADSPGSDDESGSRQP